PFISSMGAGNKMNPELIRVINIHKTTHDPLARIIRSNFRDQSFEVVASSEEVKRISGETMIGSYMPVVATFGLFASDYIIKEILRRPLCS
ncbi:MAG: tRNA threonylcarbamoyladenosine dehydratase, partial [Bacilli bacterium]